jgi:hypothetical protein
VPAPVVGHASKTLFSMFACTVQSCELSTCS